MTIFDFLCGNLAIEFHEVCLFYTLTVHVIKQEIIKVWDMAELNCFKSIT